MTIIFMFYGYLLYLIGKFLDRISVWFYKEAHIYANVGASLFQSPPTDRNLYIIVYRKDDTAFVSLGWDNVWDPEALKRKYLLSKGDVLHMESIQDFRRNGLDSIFQERSK